MKSIGVTLQRTILQKLQKKNKNIVGHPAKFTNICITNRNMLQKPNVWQVKLP